MPGYPYDIALRERMVAMPVNRVKWTGAIDNPTTYPPPCTYSIPMTEDDTQLTHEYACHEKNDGMANLLCAGREIDQRWALK